MANLIDSAYLVLGFVVLVITTAIGGSVLQGVQGSQTVNSSAFNATKDGVNGVLNFSSQMPVVGTILAAVVIIGLLLGAFVMKNGE